MAPSPSSPSRAIPLFGAHSGHFLGWWHEDDLVWRDERGEAVGYLEAAYGPWCDEQDPAFDWRAEVQEYALYRFAPGRSGEPGVPYGDVLTSVARFGPEWAGRVANSWSGPGRRAVPPASALGRRDVPARPADRSGFAERGLHDPEDCTWPV